MAKKLPLALLLKDEREHSFGQDYQHINARVVGSDKGSDDSPGGIDLPYGEREAFEDLSLRSQNEKGNAAGGNGLYGWSIEYAQPYTVDLARAEKMVKTLRLVKRRMDKVTDRLGYPESYAAFVLRVADALGIDIFVARMSDDSPWGRWRWMGPTEAESWIKAREADYIGQHQPQEVTA